MMTRNYYEPVDLDRYRQQHYPMQQWDQRSSALALSYADRRQMRSAPTCRPDRTLSDNEHDSRNNNSQTRRQRIAVAVSSSAMTASQICIGCILTGTQSVRDAVNVKSNVAEIQATVWAVKTVGIPVRILVTSFAYVASSTLKWNHVVDK